MTQQEIHELTDADVERGIEALLNDYLELADGDSAVLAYTPDSREAAALLYLALQARGVPVVFLGMRPLSDPTFRARLRQVLPEPTSFTGRLLVISLERDTMSHSNHVEAVLKDYPRSRCTVLRVISASREFFAYSLHNSPQELNRRNAYLLQRFMNATKLRIKADGGTDLTVTLGNDKYEWISNRGARRDGGTFVLPAGEVATYPSKIDGVLVADGGFNANITTAHDARLAEHPVRVVIEDSHAVSFTCDDPKTFRLMELCFNRKDATNVGELGFGTNHGIPLFIPMNSHINERRVGVHIGFGQHNQKVNLVDHHADIHLDLITQGAVIWVDDDPVGIDLATFDPGDVPHPVVHEEDVTDVDCCGLVLGELGLVEVKV